MKATSRGIGAAVLAAAAIGGVLASRRGARTSRGAGTLGPELIEGTMASAAAVVACPHCHGEVELTVRGTFECGACARSYPVRDGIVHIVAPGELGRLDRRFAHLYDWFS